MDVAPPHEPFDLRTARLNRGHTKRSLALELGVSRETIRRLELGQGGVHPQTALRIANYFGVKVTDILFPGEQAA
jgi:DNA-binding XRE family transcriptional regulator